MTQGRLIAAQLGGGWGIRLPLNCQPGTGTGAGTPHNSKAIKLLTELTGTTEQFSLEEIISCISYVVFIFFLSLKHRRNENLKTPSFLPKSSSCVRTFLKIQAMVLPAANWQPWSAPHAESDTHRWKMFSKMICQNNHSPINTNTMQSAAQDFTQNLAASAGGLRISKNKETNILFSLGYFTKKFHMLIFYLP